MLLDGLSGIGGDTAFDSKGPDAQGAEPQVLALDSRQLGRESADTQGAQPSSGLPVFLNDGVRQSSLTPQMGHTDRAPGLWGRHGKALGSPQTGHRNLCELEIWLSILHRPGTRLKTNAYVVP